jgi:ABC-type phosphate transport system substrate-binding protein
VNWPTGAGGKGNEGVAAFVGRLPNSIGYVEYAYVKQNKMTYVQLKNKDGQWVNPSDDAFKAAAAGAELEAAGRKADPVHAGVTLGGQGLECGQGIGIKGLGHRAEAA